VIIRPGKGGRVQERQLQHEELPAGVRVCVGGLRPTRIFGRDAIARVTGGDRDTLSAMALGCDCTTREVRSQCIHIVTESGLVLTFLGDASFLKSIR
jgi:hypothetical protein